MFCICNKTIETIALKKFPSEECLNHTFLKVEDNVVGLRNVEQNLMHI